MDSLARLFGSPARAKLLRLFLFNTETAFSFTDVEVRTKLTKEVARKELAALLAIGILKKRGSAKDPHYCANKQFQHFEALEAFLRATDGVHSKKLLDSIRSAGALRLVVLSGFFTATEDSKIDLLVVADTMKESALARAVRTLEAELGREIRYASFLTPDFRYRLGVYDRLIRDVLDYPHQTLLDKIGL